MSCGRLRIIKEICDICSVHVERLSLELYAGLHKLSHRSCLTRWLCRKSMVHRKSSLCDVFVCRNRKIQVEERNDSVDAAEEGL